MLPGKINENHKLSTKRHHAYSSPDIFSERKENVTDLLQAVILWERPCISIAINGDLHGSSLAHDTVCHKEISGRKAATLDVNVVLFWQRKKKSNHIENKSLLTLMLTWLAGISGADVAACC